jgi:shikimate kinase
VAECRVLLVGMMGSGKTSVGRELAAQTGWPYVDNDELVGQATGRTGRQILAEAGEMALRLAEGDALTAALTVPAPAICGIAAGTVLGRSSRRALAEGGIVVWLTADPATLAVRAVGALHRPWLEADAEDWMRETAAERAPLYREVADLIVDTEERDPEEVAAIIRAELSELAACRPWLSTESGPPRGLD